MACAIVLLAGLVGGAGGIAGAQSAGFAQLGDSTVDPDSVSLQIELLENGDAVWRIEYRLALNDENSTQAFESLQADIEEDPTPYVDRFHNRMNLTVATAENATGRSMAVSNVSVSTTRTGIPEEYGVVRYTFVWEDFAEVTEEEYRAGDAIGGLFFNEGTSLRIQWPSGYHLVSVAPPADEENDGSVVWRGPVEFSDTEPQIVISSAAPSDGGPVDDGTGVGPNVLLIVGILLGLAVLGSVAWAGYHWYGNRVDGEEWQADELLSNEEQVLSLIEARGGRMKQQDVVTELGWTDAKTSQVVKQLRENGELEGFRLGRENVLSLPDTGQDDS